MPAFFEFLITSFKKDSERYDKKFKFLKDFLSPLWNEIFKQDPEKA